MNSVTTESPTTRADDVRPDPPRFRWLKRGTLTFLLLFAFLAALRLWWGYEAHRRLIALAAAAHARGEPFWMEELQPPKVPDDQNAAVLLEQAMQDLVLTSEEEGFLKNWSLGQPLSPSDYRLVSSMPDHLREQLRLARAARARPQAQWSYELKHPLILFDLPHVNHDREIAQLLSACAIFEHLKGNDGEAIELLKDVLAVGNATETDRPSIVTHLVALGVDSIASDTVRRTAFTLRLSPRSAGDADPRLVRSLIQMLLDERSSNLGMARALWADRLIMIDTVPLMGARYGPLAAFMLRPMCELSAIHGAQHDSMTAKEVEELSFVDAEAKVREPPPQGPMSDLVTIAQSTELLTRMAPDRTLVQHYHQSVERRIAATMLALRLFAADHRGALPKSLAELVPSYLFSVPKDPFRLQPGPIGYVPNFNPAVLYSVGEDGIDQGGSGKLDPKKPRYHGPWDGEDVVFPFVAHPLVSQTDDQQADKDKGERKDAKEQDR